MRNIWLIMGKELRIYFTTWVAYVFWAVLAIFSAYVFLVRLSVFQEVSLQYLQYQASEALAQLNLTDLVLAPVLAQAAVVLLFVVPMLSMHLLAGERQGRTIELLMTLPIRTVEIVLAKYLASLVIVLIALALLGAFPVLLDQFGTTATGDSAIDWYTVLTANLGLVLFAAAALAIGLFWSSATESPLIAAFGAFVTLLLLWVLSWKASGEASTWAAILGHLSITTHIEAFLRGVLRLQDLVYYLSLIAFGLFLSHRMLEAQRWR